MEHKITIGDKYRAAMAITDQAKADEYFEECVKHCMGHGSTREVAEGIERSNLGYYSGYYDNETMVRVQRLFRCAHPIFGKAEEGKSVDPGAAMAAGAMMGAITAGMGPEESLEAARQIAGILG